MADNLFRKRDPRFADAERYKKRHRRNLFTPKDFTFPEDLSHCICPAGKRLYRSGGNVVIRGFRYVKFKGPSQPVYRVNSVLNVSGILTVRLFVR